MVKSEEREKGFTLIELMIVIAIITILAVVLLPKSRLAKTEAKWKGVENNKRCVQGWLGVKQRDSSKQVMKDIAYEEDLQKMTNPFNKSQKGVYMKVLEKGEKIPTDKYIGIYKELPKEEMVDGGQIAICRNKAYAGTRGICLPQLKPQLLPQLAPEVKPPLPPYTPPQQPDYNPPALPPYNPPAVPPALPPYNPPAVPPALPPYNPPALEPYTPPALEPYNPPAQ